MEFDFTDKLPDIIPTQDVYTTDEFTYTVYQTETEPEPTDKLELSKAPINRLDKVTAIVSGVERELTEGDDYVLQNDDYVQLLEDGVSPDQNSTIEVSYWADSIIGRFGETINEQTKKVDENLDEIVTQKFIDSADGNSLDEIGKIFGELGKRGNRDDERYREYLSSIARVYTGRGTKGSIARAVATLVSNEENQITVDEISYREFFDENEYNIRFEDFEGHQLSLLYEVAEIADPSGVRFIGPIYNTGRDGPDFIEGPAVDPNDFPQFDTIEDVPDDHIDPIAPKQNIALQWDIFEDDVTSEQQPPWDFEWAHQKNSVVKGGEGGDWNQFQWGENDWDLPDEIETEITGDEWEFADWNRITPQPESPVVIPDDGSTITDDTLTIVSDRNPNSKTVTTDDVIVRFLVGQEDISVTESVLLEIVLDIDSDTTFVADNTSIGEKVPTINDNWDDDWNSLEWTIDGSGINIQPTGVTDSNTSEVESTTFDTASINDDTVVDVAEIAWGNNWNETLVWA